MALFDIFKNKKGKEVAKTEEKKTVKRERKVSKTKTVKQNKKTEKRAEAKAQEEVKTPVSAKKKVDGLAYGVLRFPHVTEKATYLAENNRYVFKVFESTNKTEVKKAVENNYGVKVVGVRIINIKGKKVRLGKKVGHKKGYKKAIIEIAKGQKIEILPR